MASLSFSRAWDETRAIFSREGRLIWPVGLMTLVVPQLLIGTIMGPAAVAGLSADSAAATSISFLIALFLVAWARFGGLAAIARLSLHADEQVGDALRSGLRRAPSVLGATVLVFIPLTALVAPAMLAMTARQQPTPAGALMFLVGLIIGIVIFARLQFAIAVAAVEGGGPIRLLTRSWQLSAGRSLALIGFVLLFLALMGVVSLALNYTLGSLVLIALGKPQPLSVAALALIAIGLVGELLVMVPYSVMLARLYAQATGGAASVPHAP